MDMSAYNLSTLFSQLGLPSDDASIKNFVEQHKLPSETPVWDAPFWSEAQANFIHEALKEDAEWCVVIDELNVLLH